MFDARGVLWFQQFATPWLDAVAHFFTSLGSEYFYMALLPAIYWCVDRRRGHELAFLFLASMWLNGLTKDVFNLPRPSAGEGIRVLARESSPGFPSGHAQGAMTLFGYLFAEYPMAWLRGLAVAMVLLIALSRPYLGVHYLGDTLGGLAIGLLLVVIFRWGYRRRLGASWPRGLKLALALVLPLLLLPLYSESVAYQTLGFLMGCLASDLYAFAAVPFRERIPWPGQLLKLALGFAGFAVLYALHATLIPNGILELPGYAVLGVWVTTGAPYLYRRLGLAGDDAPARAAARRPESGQAGDPASPRPIFTGAALAVLLLVAGTALARPPVHEAAVSALARTDEMARTGPLVIAHRGGAGLRPENTLEAFRHAVALGADWLELDVHLTADGEVAVIHDETVDRTTGGTGSVHEMTLAELKALDAGYHWTPDGGRTFPYRGRGLRIPTLDEVLAAFPETPVLIELKDDDPALAQAVADRIRLHGAAGRVMVASFHDRTLDRFRSLAPGVATSLAHDETLRFVILQRLGLTAFHQPQGVALQVPEYSGRLKVFSGGLVRLAHDRGLAVHVWTVNDPRKMEQLMVAGVDGILTDYPDRALAVRSSLMGAR
ncbi:MAG TPA: glycerophosphodiester phosphodiesterase family protein [Thermaerobacter sp.]